MQIDWINQFPEFAPSFTSDYGFLHIVVASLFSVLEYHRRPPSCSVYNARAVDLIIQSTVLHCAHVMRCTYDGRCAEMLTDLREMHGCRCRCDADKDGKNPSSEKLRCMHALLWLKCFINIHQSKYNRSNKTKQTTSNVFSKQ